MKTALFVALALMAGTAVAQVTVHTNEMGSGTPGSAQQQATQWDNDLYHAPQYLPGYPTSATIFPRVVDVPCTKTSAGVECSGFNWSPSMGRAEYLLIRPVVKAPPPVVIKPAPPKKKAE